MRRRGQEDAVAELRAAMLDRYDVEATTMRAIHSKKTRLFLHRAMRGSEGYRLDYQPKFDATRQYARGVNRPKTA